MKILSVQSELLCEIPFLNAGKGVGGYYREMLPVHHVIVDKLPDGMSTIIATADLQGRETFESSGGKPLRLLGEVLPMILADEVLPKLLPKLSTSHGRMGAILAGDFYTVPLLDKRGGTGDVQDVWQAFADEFDWVVGVAGNHDLFDGAAKRPRFSKPVYFLDHDTVVVEDLKIGGVSGIPGNPRRPWRRTEDDFLETLGLVLCDSPSIVVMHDGPDAPIVGFRGSRRACQLLEEMESTLVVRGHSHWPEPLAELANGTQVLNVDSRVVILTEGFSSMS